MNHDGRQCERIQGDPRGDNWDEADRVHAETCPDCAACLESVGELGRRLRALPGLAAPMPDGLKARLLAQLAASATAGRAEPAGRPRRWLPPPRVQRAVVPLALAASLAAGVLIGNRVDFGAAPPPAEVRRNIGTYISDVTHDHYLFSRVGRPLEVSITDPAGLSGWLSESLNFRVRVPGSGRGFDLEGGRLWHTVGRLSALAAYDVGNGKRALLFAVPAANLDLSGAPSTLIKGRRVYRGSGWDCEARVWIDGDLAMALVAPEGRLPASWVDTFLP